MHHNLDDFYIFCQVVKSGSMKGASEALEIPLSTVSRRIANLEESVRSPLFIRSKNALTPTNLGHRYFERLSSSLTSLTEELDALQEETEDVAGKVTIDCTDFVYRFFLHDRVQAILKKYPKLKIRFIPSSDTNNFDPEADLAVLTGALPDSNLVAKKLLSLKVKVVAAPNFVDTPPSTLAELRDYEYIGFLKQDLITGYNKKKGSLESIRLYPKASLSNTESCIEMVEQGIGFTYMSDYFVEQELKEGRLVSWLEDYELDSRNIHLVYRHRTQKTRAQQVVIDAITESFKRYEESQD